MEQSMILKLGMQHKYYQNPSNDYSRFTFDLFFRKVKFTPLCIYKGKSLNKRFFQNIVKTKG